MDDTKQNSDIVLRINYMEMAIHADHMYRFFLKEVVKVGEDQPTKLIKQVLLKKLKDARDNFYMKSTGSNEVNEEYFLR